MKSKIIALSLLACLVFLAIYFGTDFGAQKSSQGPEILSMQEKAQPEPESLPVLDREVYDLKLNQISGQNKLFATSSSSTIQSLWPAKAPYPNYGAILPFKRVVAFYGNLYSKGMGVLGEYPEDVMLAKLAGEVEKWQAADTETPVVPALHYIAVVAQAKAGRDGKYRARMPEREIDKVLAMAEKIDGIVFLDFQVGLSDIRFELPAYEKYIKMPNVHIGIDPEFYMRNGQKPGEFIGTMDAADINWAAEYLSTIVKSEKLTPKILVIHRFTRPMVTNSEKITPLPEVQIVMDMDGFGSQGSKLNTYKQFIYKEPVQFTGFKLFYKNDSLGGKAKLFSPAQLLQLIPQPSYIQYQ